MTLEMYFCAELVQVIVSWSDSELEVQRLLVAFALTICLFTAAELPELAWPLSFHLLPPQSLHPHECMRVAARVSGSVWPVTDATLVSMTSIRLRKCIAQIQL